MARPRRRAVAVAVWIAALAAVDGGTGQHYPLLRAARPRDHAPRPRMLALRGGSGAPAELVVPDSYDTLGKALAAFAADANAAVEGLVTFRAGNHSIGTEELGGMGVALARDEFRLRVRGEPGATLAGCWRLAGGGGELGNLRLLDVVILSAKKHEGEFLHPGIMYGDCCLAVTGSRPWLFSDCEVQCSGTALRAYEDADVTCERLVTGGDEVSKLPPTNIFDMDLKPWLRQLLLEGLDVRNKTTGLPLYQESSMPRYGVTAWGRAHVRLIDCKIINMTLNGLSASENATMEVQGSCISGSGMAGVFLEGSCVVTLTSCLLKDNLCCLSVWGGYGEERWVKVVGTDPRGEEGVVVEPASTLIASGNKFVGTVWAGMTRPASLQEDDNEIVDEGEPSDSEEVPFYMESAEIENGTAIRRWDIYEPVSTPKWAPKGKLGGDGVVQWGPSDGFVDRDPAVILDVSLHDPSLRPINISAPSETGPGAHPSLPSADGEATALSSAAD
jgi:hypothetical protein